MAVVLIIPMIWHGSHGINLLTRHILGALGAIYFKGHAWMSTSRGTSCQLMLFQSCQCSWVWKGIMTVLVAMKCRLCKHW